MADDNVLIQPSASTPGTPVSIKTFLAKDPSSIANADVEIQAVAIVGPQGDMLNLLTEETGQQILNMLRQINNILAITYGIGHEEEITR